MSNSSLPLSSNEFFLVRLRNVNVSLSQTPILKGIDWELKPGEHWAFLGENGSGKTTLARLIRGEIWPDADSIQNRVYHLNGEIHTSPLHAQQQIAWVCAELQEAYTRHHWNLTVEEVIHSGFFNSVWLFQKPDRAQREIANCWIESMALNDYRKRNFLELSQGEARRVLIARALVSQPRILILDEFCNGVDAPSRENLLAIVESIAQSGTQLISITHHLSELVPAIGRMLEMREGRIIRQGSRSEIQEAMQQEQSTTKPDRHIQIPRNHHETLLVSPEPLIEIEHTDVFLRNKKVLWDIQWKLEASQSWVVLGKNGSGKSTFLSLLYGDLHPAYGGVLRRFGQIAVDETVWNIKNNIGFLSPFFQADYSYNETGEEVVLSGFYSTIGLWETPDWAMRKTAERWIEFFGLSELVKQEIRSMSYGQLRKILLARAMVNDPRILLMDEPCSGLDFRSRVEFLQLLDALIQTGISLVYVTHDPEEIIPSITHALIFEKGRMIAQGRKKEILAKFLNSVE